MMNDLLFLSYTDVIDPLLPKGSDKIKHSHNDVIDRNVNELDDEANKSHDGEPDGCGHCNLLELLAVGLCAPLDEAGRVLAELLRRLHDLHHLIHAHNSGKKYCQGNSYIC